MITTDIFLNNERHDPEAAKKVRDYFLSPGGGDSVKARQAFLRMIIGTDRYGKPVGLSFSMIARVMNCRFTGHAETAASVRSYLGRWMKSFTGPLPKMPDCRPKNDTADEVSMLVEKWGISRKVYDACEKEMTRWYR